MTAEHEAAEGQAKATAAPVASTPEARARRMSDSPDIVRLERLLTELTKPPPTPVATAGTKDARVRPAGGARPIAETVAPPH